MKLIRKFKRWLIYKLGGFTCDWVDDVKGCLPGYWERKSVSANLFVSPDHYKPEYAESIESELARLIGLEMLKNGLIFFDTSGPKYNHGDVFIRAVVDALGLKDRQSYHMPNHLKFEEENDD